MRLVAGLAIVFALARIHLVGLSDPSEGRYAQIAWEMTERGDWLVPHWNGKPHLEKPPLAFWAGALGVTLFGRHELAVRLLPAIALVAAAFLTAGIARRIAGARAGAPAFAGVLLAPYPMAVGLALLTDVFVLFATALFFHAVVRRRDGEGALDWAAVALGLGILAKGHVVLLFTVAPLALAGTGFFLELWRPRRLLILAALTAPWLVSFELRHPGFLALHARKLADFVGEAEVHHRAPFYIYAAVLTGGMVPFSLWLRAGRRALARRDQRLLYTWLLLPLVVLTLLPSRSWTYILPAAPVVAIVGAAGLVAEGPRPRRQANLLLIGGLATVVVGCVAGGRVGEFAPVLLLVGAATAGGGVLLHALGRRAVVPAALVLCAAMTSAALLYEGHFKIHRALARKVAEIAEGREVAAVGISVPSLPFYLGRPVPAVWEDQSRILLTDRTRVLVTLPSLVEALPLSRRPVFSQRESCVLAPGRANRAR